MSTGVFDVLFYLFFSFAVYLKHHQICFHIRKQNAIKKKKAENKKERTFRDSSSSVFQKSSQIIYFRSFLFFFFFLLCVIDIAFIFFPFKFCIVFKGCFVLVSPLLIYEI